MNNRIIRNQIEIISGFFRIFQKNAVMKNAIIVEISKTEFFFQNFQFINIEEMNVDATQTNQIFFFAEKIDIDDETKYFRFKRTKKKAIRIQKLQRLREREQSN